MPDFTNTLVVGISSRTLFDLEEEDKLFKEKGIIEYRKIQREKENEELRPGTAYHLVQALLNLNKLSTTNRLVEVIILSSNSPETGVRILNSIKSLSLDITRSAFTGGEKISGYIDAFSIDLFLSKSEIDVQEVIDSKTAAAALILEHPTDFNASQDTVRIAFDADAVLFADDSEQIYKSEGMAAFHKNESENENIPLKEGPHGKLLKTLSKIQQYMDTTIELTPLRIAIVTARNSPSHMRVIRTLRDWDVYVDEAFFLGGISKDKVLKAFNAHIFFDDQDVHLNDTKKVVPSAKVPYHSDSPLSKQK
ncbi:5'-nucleotidase [Flavobacterium sp. LS2P90]|uniref:5'-nucleotidase n=1 Tax=Flavobacterium xylosi TaxID=3230415 RepID=A0ABW6HV00_9FLAO